MSRRGAARIATWDGSPGSPTATSTVPPTARTSGPWRSSSMERSSSGSRATTIRGARGSTCTPPIPRTTTPRSMCPGPPWSTSSSCASSRRPVRRRAFTALTLAALLALVFARDADAAATPKPILLATLSGPGGERDIEAHDPGFVYFKITYRQTRAPRDEVPGGERTTVIADREECRCLRFLDWSKIKMKKIRAIEIAHAPGQRVSTVRVTRRDGQVREYPATALYGGDGLYPPFFSLTIEGVHREFPLILEERPGLEWPEENLVRIFWTTTTPPPRPRPPAKSPPPHESKGSTR